MFKSIGFRLQTMYLVVDGARLAGERLVPPLQRARSLQVSSFLRAAEQRRLFGDPLCCIFYVSVWKYNYINFLNVTGSFLIL